MTGKEQLIINNETILQALDHADFNAHIRRNRLRDYGRNLSPDEVRFANDYAEKLELLVALKPLFFRPSETSTALGRLLITELPLLMELSKFMTGESYDYEAFLSGVRTLSFDEIHPGVRKGKILKT